jgi:hypothetical protein
MGYGLDSLTPLERVICGPLIKRQFDRGPRIQREMAIYGLRGTARLCSGRAISVFTVGFVLAFMALSIAGEGVGASVFLVLLLASGALGVARLLSAARAGRKWRSENTLSRPGGSGN